MRRLRRRLRCGSSFAAGLAFLEVRLDQRQADLPLVGVDLDDADLDALANLDHVLRVLDLVVRQLRDVQQPLEALLKLDEDAEVGDLGDRARHRVADVVTRRDVAAPRVGLQLLEAERDALLLLVDREHHALDLVALLHHLVRVGDLAGPRHVRDVQQAVDALLQLDERAVVGEVADLAADDRARRVVLRHHVPRVDLGLLHAERDRLLFGVDLEHHDLDLLALADDLVRVVDALGPRHLGDVHQTFDAVLELDERAVAHEVDDLAVDALADRVLVRDVVPRRSALLLHSEGDALSFVVDLEDLDLDFLVELDHLRRVVHPTPRHVRDVQQAVDAPEVDEHAEVGDVLDDAHADLAFLELLEQGFLLGLALFFDQLAARDDDVHPLLVDLDDARLDVLADPVADVAGAADVDLRCRQEDRDADVDQQTALDLAQGHALDRVTFLVGKDDVFPTTNPVGLPLAQQDVAFGVVDRLDEALDLGARLDLERVRELVDRDLAFGLVADVDDHGAVFLHLDHLAAHDLVRGELSDGLTDRVLELVHGRGTERFGGQPRQLVVGQGELLD